MLKKIRKFFDLSLRAKLETLKSKTNLRIYPSQLKNKLISSFYYKIIFFLSSKEYFKKQYKFKYNILFNSKLDYKKIKLIMSFPRSGGTFVNSIFSSYFEIKKGIGSGHPKYMYDVDRLFFTKNAIDIPTDIFSFSKDPIEDVYLDNNFVHFDYDKPIVAFENNIFNSVNEKQVYLIRDPNTACLSYLKYVLTIYTHIVKKQKKFDEKIVIKRIDYVTNQYIEYLSEIEKFKLQRNCLIVKFENLNNDTLNTIEGIFNFFEIKIDREILNKSIEINLKNNFIKRIYNQNSNRFSKRVFDKDLKDFIQKILEKKLKDASYRYNRL